MSSMEVSLDRYIMSGSRNRRTRLGIEYIRRPAYLPDKRCGAACRTSEPGHRWSVRNPFPTSTIRVGARKGRDETRDQAYLLLRQIMKTPWKGEREVHIICITTWSLANSIRPSLPVLVLSSDPITVFHTHNIIGGGIVGLKVFKEQKARDLREDSHKRRKVSKSCVI
jgi:hypothetical protein